MEDKKTAPYAPATSVIGVIRHYRDRDVPARLTLDMLRQIGVTDALVHRTLAALRFLGLVDDDGTTTDVFRKLRFATSDEYPEAVGELLDDAYADVIQHIDVSEAEYRDVANAFIPYTPGTQRKKMIGLFLGLCREAGWTVGMRAGRSSISPGETRERKPTSRKVRPVSRQAAEATGSVVFAVTDRDMAALDETEFNEVWQALGKVARARARINAAPNHST